MSAHDPSAFARFRRKVALVRSFADDIDNRIRTYTGQRSHADIARSLRMQAMSYVSGGDHMAAPTVATNLFAWAQVWLDLGLSPQGERDPVEQIAQGWRDFFAAQLEEPALPAGPPMEPDEALTPAGVSPWA